MVIKRKILVRSRFYPLWVINIIICFLSCTLFAQKNAAEVEAQVKAAYIFNFTKFLDWKKSSSEYFSIVVLGKSEITTSLYKIANKEKVKGKTIIVNEITDLLDVADCRILFLPKEDKKIFEDVLRKVKGKSILVITNSGNFAENGAGISFISVGNKIKFEINRKVLEEEGIIPNSSLLSLAYKVYK